MSERTGDGEAEALAEAWPADASQPGCGAPSMVLSHRSERSILDAANLSDYPSFSVGGRIRHATCSDVAWFAGRHLAAVNLYGAHLRIYRFDDGGDGGLVRLQLLHEVGEGVPAPEGVDISPDGTRLAVSH